MRPEVTLRDLIDLRDQGGIVEWATQLKTDFEQFVAAHRPEIAETGMGRLAVVDVTDFLLRVIEDDTLGESAVRSGDDGRVVHYMNVAIRAVSAIDAATGIAALVGHGRAAPGSVSSAR